MWRQRTRVRFPAAPRMRRGPRALFARGPSSCRESSRVNRSGPLRRGEAAREGIPAAHPHEVLTVDRWQGPETSASEVDGFPKADDLSMTLDPSDVDAALAELEGWTNAGDALTKTFTFDDFAAAMDFMQRAAGPIDETDHHPEWTNVYNRVDVRLSSHDAGGITDRDLAWRRRSTARDLGSSCRAQAQSRSPNWNQIALAMAMYQSATMSTDQFDTNRVTPLCGATPRRLHAVT